MKKALKIVALLLVLVFLLAGCDFLSQFLPKPPDDGETPSNPTQPIEPSDPEPVTPVEPEPEPFEDYGMKVIEIYLSKVSVEKDGIYDSMEEVAVYIYLYKCLPGNYNNSSSYVKKNHTAENKLSYTGGTFYNREGLLPTATGRTFTECDIGYKGGNRNALRIVFSSDGLIFYTTDHYASFSIVRIFNDVD